MPLLNDALNVKLGSTQVERVYLGTDIIWENEKPSSIVLSISPTTVTKGESVTLTATCGADQPPNSTVKFRSGSPSGTIVAQDNASPWTATVVPTASTTYYAELLENRPYLAAVSAGKSVVVNTTTSISLAVSTSTITKGQSLTLTATVTGATSGTVRFREGSPSGAIVATDTASPWTATVSPTSSTTYYAEYVANGTILGSVSSGKGVTVMIPTSVSLAASSTTVSPGTAVTLTATVTGASSGSVRFRVGSPTGSIIATDSSAPWAVTVNPTSSTTYYAEYVANGVYLGSTSAARSVAVQIATSLSLSASKTTINNGESLTLTATLSGASSGTVYFRTGSTSGAVVASDSSSPYSVTVSPTSSTTYYATYSANGDYLASSSGGVGITVRQLSKKTWSAKASWSASYTGSGSKRTTDPLYFGYYSSTQGNQRSLIGWDLPSDLVGCASIDSMEVEFYVEHTYLNSGGKTVLGTHNYVNEPSTWSGSRVDDNIKGIGDLPKPGWHTEGLGNSFKPQFISGDAKGLALGPGPTSSTDYYGYATGAGTNRPLLTIVYYVWV